MTKLISPALWTLNLANPARGDRYFSFYFEYDPWQNGQSDPIRMGNSRMAAAGVSGLTSIEYFGNFRSKSKNPLKIPILLVINSDKSTGLLYDVKPRK